MTAKEYLSQYRSLSENIKTQQYLLHEYQLAENINLKVGGGESGAEIFQKGKQSILSEIERLENIRKNILDIVTNNLSGNERTVIELRYILGLSFNETVDQLGYCRAQTSQYMRNALKKIAAAVPKLTT